MWLWQGITSFVFKEAWWILSFFYTNAAVRLKILNEYYMEITTMEIIKADKRREFRIQPVDAKDRPAAIDGIPVWSVSPEGGVLLFPAPDGMTCDVVWASAKVAQTVTVKADADTGTGIVEITGSVEVQTLPAQAVGFVFTFGPEMDV